MPDSSQTSVLVTPAARQALWRLTARWAISRDETVRRLLGSFVRAQTDLNDDERLTHIATVVGYPRCLPVSHQLANSRLAIRAPADLLEDARAVAYHVPGKAHSRAHPDYAQRPITDAITTALALEEPFIDPGLEGLPSVLTARQSNDLWALVVAGTLTRAEREARDPLDPDHVLVDLLRDVDVAWHSPERSQVALHIAHHYLTDTATPDNPFAPGAPREVFEVAIDALEHSSPARPDEATEGAVLHQSNAEGRGATALWRARRLRALDALENALVRGNELPFLMQPPGWILAAPAEWGAARVPPVAALPAHQQQLVDAGAVFRLRAGSLGALWPWSPERAGPAAPGLADFAAGGRDVGAKPLDIVEGLLLAMSLIPETETPLAGPRRPSGAPWPEGLADALMPVAQPWRSGMNPGERIPDPPPLDDLFSRRLPPVLNPRHKDARDQDTLPGVLSLQELLELIPSAADDTHHVEPNMEPHDQPPDAAVLASSPFLVEAGDAARAGLITTDEYADLQRIARESNEATIAQTLDHARRDHWPSADIERLKGAATDIDAFTRICAEWSLRPEIVVASHRWALQGVDDLLSLDLTTDQRRERGRIWSRRVRALRDYDMDNAWRDAMWRRRAEPPDDL